MREQKWWLKMPDDDNEDDEEGHPEKPPIGG